jgi:hypothetical protein
MATPKPGEIRCPTCHRSTPPAAFCTQCGSAIPSDARIRPRGMDRDELQDRIRQRRSGGEPYRRGVPADGYTGYERYEAEPEDSQARRTARPHERRQDVFRDREPAAAVAPPFSPTPAAPPPPEDPRQASLVPPIEPAFPEVTREADDWARPATSVASAPPPTESPPPTDWPVEDAEYVEHVDNFDDAAYDDDGYPYAYEWDDERDRRSSGAGAFAILGFLALGVLALLGGAVIAGLFSGDPTGAADPTLTPSPTLSESLEPTPTAVPSATASVAASPSAGASGEPVVFPDGFTAQTQPCIPGSAGTNGCNSNGASNSGSVWVWVGFRSGTQDDVMSATVLSGDGTVIGNGSIELARINCGRVCNGWTYFPFGNLQPGTYDVMVERNGQLAAETVFTVE